MNELPTESERKIDLAERLKRFRHSVPYLIVVATASSFVLATYVLAVGNFLIHRKDIDTLGVTTLAAANEIASITVDTEFFGKVGLCDRAREDYDVAELTQGASGPTRSVNNVLSNLRLCAIVSSKLKHPIIARLTADDLSAAKTMQWQLKEKILAAIENKAVMEDEPVGMFGFQNFFNKKQEVKDGNYIYRNLYYAIARKARATNSRLIGLIVTPGYLRWRVASSQMPAPPHTDNLLADETGFYRAGLPIDTPGSSPLMFVTLANRTQLIDANNFIQDSRASVPSAILVEAKFATPTPDGRSEVSTNKVACAVVGSRPVAYKPSALILNFPFGLPRIFFSANDILNANNWLNTGTWREAFGGDVPGVGKLTRPQNIFPGEKHTSSGKFDSKCRMYPNQAFAVSLYHWLESLPPNADPAKILYLIGTDWRRLSQFNSIGKSEEGTASTGLFVNSYLAQDDNHRADSLLDQSEPGGEGQHALQTLFANKASINSILEGAPSSALPLMVGVDGNCNLSGGRGFDEKSVKQFLEDVYETNLAALESLSVSTTVMEKVARARARLNEQLALAKEEANSINAHLNRESSAPESNVPPKEKSAVDPNQHQVTLLNQKLNAIKKVIEDDEKQSDQLSRMLSLTHYAIVNSKKAAEATYRITANAFTLCRNSVRLLPTPQKRYLIGNELVFTPSNQPLSEFDFDDAIESDPGKTPSIWLSSTYQITVDLRARQGSKEPKVLPPDLANLKNTLTAPPVENTIKPAIVVFDSQTTLPKRSAEALLLSKMPFFDGGVPSGQLLYYCQNAISTGKDPSINWSVLIRDVGNSHLRGNFAEPLVSPDEDWAKQKDQALGVCPGLITEFQLRTPLPDLLNFPPGSVVRNEAGQKASQIPPVPEQTL